MSPQSDVRLSDPDRAQLRFWATALFAHALVSTGKVDAAAVGPMLDRAEGLADALLDRLPAGGR